MASRTVNLNLPKRILRRTKKLKSGKYWVSYYYGVTINGKRKELPLGKDLLEATKKWAEFEKKAAPTQIYTLGDMFDLYIDKGMIGLSKRTVDDYLSYIKQLKKVFKEAPLAHVTPKDIADYRDARTAKTRANRELAMLSIIYNFAIDKGYCSTNPATKVKRNKEKLRTYYATDEIYYSVRKHAEEIIQDLMDVAYLSGQRPTDVREIRKADISKDHLFVGQNKTNKKLRIKLNNEEGRTVLGAVIDEILAKKKDDSPYLFSENGKHLTYAMFRKRFTKARGKAINEATNKNDSYFAEQIKDFQFKDLRPKSASDMNDLSSASNLLGHTKEQITKMIYLRKGQEVKPLEVNIKEQHAEKI